MATGTSAVENLNNFIANYRPCSQGHASLPTVQMSLKVACFQYNIR